jgi:hypothetical protein
MKVIGTIVSLVALVLWGFIATFFVATKIWGWFMIPFFGAPELTIPLYFGLACFVGLFVPLVSVDTEEEDSYGLSIFKQFIKVTTTRAVTLLIAWIAFLCV